MATILFADNDARFAESRGWFLEQEGWTVLYAGSPEVAEKILASGQIDLFLCDLRLVDDLDPHDWSGLHLIRKAQVPHKILMSASLSESIVEQAAEAGAEAIDVAAGAEVMLELIWLMLQNDC